FPSAPDGVSPFFDFPDMDLGLADMVKAALYKSMLFGDRDFDYVLWTISIEFYGSLLVFGAYALMGRHRMPAMVLSALTGLALLGFERPAALYGLFFLGASLAYVNWQALQRWSDRRAAAVSISLLVVGCYLAGFYA